jgi:POT family proton-dependent oligopeptide transporter
MQSLNKNSINIFDEPVLGHPQGLFILFFTEMWERFSYYGMRALLVLFLMSSIGEGGWDWTSAQALSLYGTYTSMVYLTPILGGYLADRYLGYRNAVLIGAIIMTLGHVSMALEFHHIFLYIGIGCLIVGNGFFKPNMTSIISTMYKDAPEKKDGAYTIFYMGVNAGSFLGIMLCGYLGETLGWSYGFGLAGIFMILGMIQFYFSQKIFGNIGEKPVKVSNENPKEVKLEFEGDRLNPFTQVDKIIVFICALAGLIWVINDPMNTIAGSNILKFGSFDASNYVILGAVILFFYLLFSRIIRYPKITRDRMLAIVTFALFMIIYNASFEQAGGSMTIFAKQFTARSLVGSYATLFTTIDFIITVVPILVITWVLFMLFKRIYKKYVVSTIVLIISFSFVWILIGWKLNRDMNSKSFKIEYSSFSEMKLNEESGKKEEVKTLVYMDSKDLTSKKLNTESTDISVAEQFNIGSEVYLLDTDKKGKLMYIEKSRAQKIEPERLIKGKVTEIKKGIEVKASWFGILNSLFIIILAPLFSKWWESKFNPGASVKYGIGLIFIGLGFGALALGSMGIIKGATSASVSMLWLVAAYLFHTLGELCISPVSLSYVSKLVPGRMIALMFGIWYIALAIGNKIAGKMGGQIEAIQENHSISYFFLIFTIIPASIGVIAVLIYPALKKIMHGVK